MQSSIVTKLISLLTLVSETHKPMTFSQLVDASGLNKSTLHRLLAICMEEKLLQYDKQRKTYLVGPKIFELVRNAYHGYDIQILALDEMLRLHKLVKENVTVGVPEGNEVVYLRILEADIHWGATQRPGMREPIHCSASGKVLLSFLPNKTIHSRLEGYEFTRFTDRTITSADAMWEQVQTIRLNGVATNDREEYDRLLGMSAPIFNYVGEPIAVLNIWTIEDRKSLSELTQWGSELITSAERVTALIGGVAPSLQSLEDD
ncbi:IclR family transcriptional regulator [uncultured Tateyamaria sp.]|uniref:IclR family transcriptional regulator n=1 Tax=uncultured Tateyamaria sp. TaxID=455651 RepID=UPI002618601D|nr:IclR family transcriptional regulator [uncultured Tateyamaria sp.]